VCDDAAISILRGQILIASSFCAARAREEIFAQPGSPDALWLCEFSVTSRDWHGPPGDTPD
jgi:hypothetical protein